MNTSLENMTVREIKDLKEQCRQDFIKLTKEFFKSHPLVDEIVLSHHDWKHFCTDIINLDEYNYVNDILKVNLKNEPEL